MSYVNKSYLLTQFQNFANRLVNVFAKKQSVEDIVEFSNTQPTSEDNKIWVNEQTLSSITILETSDIAPIVQEAIDDGTITTGVDPELREDVDGLMEDLVEFSTTQPTSEYNQIWVKTNQESEEQIVILESSDVVSIVNQAIASGTIVVGGVTSEIATDFPTILPSASTESF